MQEYTKILLHLAVSGWIVALFALYALWLWGKGETLAKRLVRWDQDL